MANKTIPERVASIEAVWPSIENLLKSVDGKLKDVCDWIKGDNGKGASERLRAVEYFVEEYQNARKSNKRILFENSIRFGTMLFLLILDALIFYKLGSG